MGEAAPAGSVGARLEFEMKRMEAEERRAQESQQIIMPFLHILKPPLPYYGPVPPYLSYQDAVAPGHPGDLAFPPGAPTPPAPSVVR